MITQSLPHSTRFTQCLEAYRAYKADTSVANADQYDRALEVLAYERGVSCEEEQFCNLIGEVMQAASTPVKPVVKHLTRAEKAERMYRAGYRLSQSIYNRNVFYVHKPSGETYKVTGQMRCECHDYRKFCVPCKHCYWVDLYIANFDRLIAKAVAETAAKPAIRNRMGARRAAVNARMFAAIGGSN